MNGVSIPLKSKVVRRKSFCKVRLASKLAVRNARIAEIRQRRASGSKPPSPFCDHRPAADFFRLNRARLISAAANGVVAAITWIGGLML
jgi:hypothetical protein